MANNIDWFSLIMYVLCAIAAFIMVQLLHRKPNKVKHKPIEYYKFGSLRIAVEQTRVIWKDGNGTERTIIMAVSVSRDTGEKIGEIRRYMPHDRPVVHCDQEYIGILHQGITEVQCYAPNYLDFEEFRIIVEGLF